MEKDLNSYRLTSLEEPTDEMLSAIMKEVAEEVRQKNAETDKRLIEQIREQANENKQRLGL